MVRDPYKEDLERRAEEATGLEVVDLQIAGETVFVLEREDGGEISEDLLDDTIQALNQGFPKGEYFKHHRTHDGTQLSVSFKGLEEG